MIKFASEEVQKTRRDICHKCEYKILKMKIEMCSKCGCVIPVKATISSSKCPLNKW